MNNENGKKSKAGSNNSKELFNRIEKILSSYSTLGGRIILVPKKKGKDAIQGQFGYDCAIIFDNSVIWIIKTTTSIRSDRIKGSEFDILHLKKWYQNKKNYKVQGYLVLLNEDSELEKLSQKIKTKTQISYFDDAITLNTLIAKLQTNLRSMIPQGIESNISGYIGEYEISSALNNPTNIKLWNNPNNQVDKSSNFDIFKNILKAVGFTNKKIKNVIAYTNDKDDKKHYLTDLATVKNGGMPKTDILAIITADNGKEYKVTFSVKAPRRPDSRISVHQGSVEDMIYDLKKSSFDSDEKLSVSNIENALLNFQASGSEKYMDSKQADILKKELPPINEWLVRYALFGENNHKLNEIQVAQYLVYINPQNHTVNVYSANEITQKLINQNYKKSGFGTPFSWTYPSKRKGKNIQLKLNL